MAARMSGFSRERLESTAARVDNLGSWISDRIHDPNWIANGNSDLCLSANGSAQPGAILVQAKCLKNVPDQLWSVSLARVSDDPLPGRPVEAPYGSIRNGRGLCLDVAGGRFARGVQIIQATCDTSRVSQTWRVSIDGGWGQHHRYDQRPGIWR